jgi:hypothetical protein
MVVKLLSIKLHFEPASCKILNAIRRKYKHSPVERWGVDLLHHFVDTPSTRTLLENTLSEMAYRQPLFKVRLTNPIINPFITTSARSISYEAYETGREDREITGEIYHALSERTKEADRLAKGVRRQRMRPFRPRVNILYGLSEEEANRIVDELRTTNEDGLGEVVADGFLLGDLQKAWCHSPTDPYEWKFFPFKQREARILHV